MNMFKDMLLGLYRDKNIIKLNEEDVNLLRRYFEDEKTFPLEKQKAKNITLVNNREDNKRRIFVLDKEGNIELPWRNNPDLPI